MCQLLKGTTKEKTHKKQTKKKHFVSGLGKDCSFPVFSLFFFLLRRFWYGFWYLSGTSFSFPFFHKSLWMNLTIDCRVFENVTWSKGNLFIINTFTEKCVFADYFYPFLSTLLSFLFLFFYFWAFIFYGFGTCHNRKGLSICTFCLHRVFHYTTKGNLWHISQRI